MSFASIEEAAADIRDGRMVIIVDDEDRENEGDLVCAAEKVTPEIINFMATHARGLICMPLTEERCDELHLTMQVADNTSFLGTAFTVSIEARKGVTTGISASDRATTILTAVDPKTRPQDLARPGHVFPLRAKKGGVLVRPRMRKEILVRRAVETDLPTVYGMFRAIAFENVLSEEVHLAMVMGEVRTDEAVLVRVHTENVTCDMFGSLIDDTGFQLHAALERIAAEGRGVVLYLRQRQNNLDLVHQLRTYQLMSEGALSKEEASLQTGYGSDRDYGVGAQILHELGLRRILLLSNHPPRVSALEGFELEIVGNVPLGTPARVERGVK